MSNLSRDVAAAALSIAILAAVAPQARAEDISRARLVSLARKAAHDPSALEELRRVTSVDGAPVDLRRALTGASGTELSHRLRALAQAKVTRGVEPATARQRADEVLSQPRFQQTALPRPFEGVLRWLGRRLRAVADWLTSWLPGGRATLWSIVAMLIVAASTAVALRLARRRAAGEVQGQERVGERRRPSDPAELEQEAQRAEAGGDLERAVRLRFIAGLLRLDKAHALAFRPSLTSGEVARRLRSPSFEQLARTFDEIVYGGRPAAPDDVRLAREKWPRVLEEAIAA